MKLSLLLQACQDSHEFRDDQCAAYNSNPYQGSLYEWSAHYDEENPCSLTCKGKPINVDDILPSSTDDPVMVVAKLAEKVHDGSRCRPGSLDMCIDGKCQVNNLFLLYFILNNFT